MANIVHGKSICTECGSTNLLRDNEAGELVCLSCGFVISTDILDNGPEWRAFNREQQENLSRVGLPSTWIMHDKGLFTSMGWRDNDSKGKKTDQEDRARLQRLRKWHKRSRLSDYKQRALALALKDMSKLSYTLNLPRNVVETSSMIYRQAIKKRLAKGRAIQTLVVASIYLACRQCRIVRTLKEVAEVANISRKEAAKHYRLLLNELKSSAPKIDPKLYISKIVNKLSLTSGTEMLAITILRKASELKLTNGRKPMGIAAACVYISSLLMNEGKSQGDIAQVAQVTDFTVRTRYKELFQQLQFNIFL